MELFNEGSTNLVIPDFFLDSGAGIGLADK